MYIKYKILHFIIDKIVFQIGSKQLLSTGHIRHICCV